MKDHDEIMETIKLLNKKVQKADVNDGNTIARTMVDLMKVWGIIYSYNQARVMSVGGNVPIGLKKEKDDEPVKN